MKAEVIGITLWFYFPDLCNWVPFKVEPVEVELVDSDYNLLGFTSPLN